ncbi:MAG TPA: AraC family transcriptional regulator, partial [Sediminibacterium sp.]|nr:AraC family transcriptional regulator [Sediminibacterium sp.]
KNAKGVKRVIGDHMEDIDDLELVLVGPNLQHTWRTHNCTSTNIQEVTIQFHKDLFGESLLSRNQLNMIRSLMEKAQRGILFSQETAKILSARLLNLGKKKGFDSILELMSILNDLSLSKDMMVLSNATFNNQEVIKYNSRRIEKVMEYINKNYQKSISLQEVAQLTNMAEAAFSRFFKNRSGLTFVETLTDIRLGHATRMLINSTQSISEIAYQCGFNNISNFNRIFKKKKGCSPKEFRESYASEARVLI